MKLSTIYEHLAQNLWPFFIPTPRALRTARRHGISEFWFPWNTCSQTLHSSLPFRPSALKFLLNERREEKATRRRVKKGFLQVIRSSKVAVCKLTLSQSFDKSLFFTLHHEKISFASVSCYLELSLNLIQLALSFVSWKLSWTSRRATLLKTSEVSQNLSKQLLALEAFVPAQSRLSDSLNILSHNNETIMRVIKTFSKVNFLRAKTKHLWYDTI